MPYWQMLSEFLSPWHCSSDLKQQNQQLEIMLRVFVGITLLGAVFVTVAHSGLNELVFAYCHIKSSEFFVPIYVIVGKTERAEKVKDGDRRWSCREKRNNCKDSCKCRMPTLSFAFLPVLSKPLTECSRSPPLSVCLLLSISLSLSAASIR